MIKEVNAANLWVSFCLFSIILFLFDFEIRIAMCRDRNRDFCSVALP